MRLADASWVISLNGFGIAEGVEWGGLLLRCLILWDAGLVCIYIWYRRWGNWVDRRRRVFFEEKVFSGGKCFQKGRSSAGIFEGKLAVKMGVKIIVGNSGILAIFSGKKGEI